MASDSSGKHRSKRHKHKDKEIYSENDNPESLALAQVRRDFDEALRRAVPSRGRRRGLDEETELDAQSAKFVDRMRAAAAKDCNAISSQSVAVYKIEMLPEVLGLLSRRDLIEFLLDNRVLDAVKMWLEPYPDGTLPSIDVRKGLLEVLLKMPIEKIHLKESGLGKIIMYLYKCPDETKDNKKLAYQLIDKWSRPIIGHSLNYKDLSRVVSPSSGSGIESRLPFVLPPPKEGVHLGNTVHARQTHPYKNLMANMDKLKQKSSKNKI